MNVLSWRTVSALTRVLLWYKFPSLLRNSENNPLVSAIPHSSTYTILYISNSEPDGMIIRKSCKWLFGNQYISSPAFNYFIQNHCRGEIQYSHKNNLKNHDNMNDIRYVINLLHNE